MSSSHITSDQANSDQPTTFGRRASLSAGTVLSDFFTSNRSPPTTNAYPGPIASAAAQANQRRRMSMSNITGTSPPRLQTDFRRGSVSSMSSTSSAIDESAIEDGELTSGSPPMSPFARRLSFGARALRDVRIPTGRTGGYTAPPASSPTVARGFWPDNSKVNSNHEKTTESHHQRRQSMSTMPQPVSSMTPKEPSVDPFQERMLKGDFYID